MPVETTQQHKAGLTIQEMAERSELSEHTLRYYERISLLSPIPRDNSSGHRRYPPETVGLIESLACMRGTGMSIRDIRLFLRLHERGASAAAEQKALFAAHRAVLADEMERMEIRMKYLAGKVAYWEAVEEGDTDKAREIGEGNHRIGKTIATKKEKR